MGWVTVCKCAIFVFDQAIQVKRSLAIPPWVAKINIGQVVMVMSIADEETASSA